MGTLSTTWEKKKKLPTPYFFILKGIGGKEKSETIFCTDSQQSLDKWISAAKASLDLG
jgi:hypothetical protein